MHLTTNVRNILFNVFALPTPTVETNTRFRVGKRVFRLTSSSTNVKNEGLITTSAEADYTAKGLIQTVQGTVISTRETRVQRTTQTDTKSNHWCSTTTRVVRETVGEQFDTVCQSFMVDTLNGVFVSSIEVFFAKSKCIICDVQIRTMTNGY